MNLRHILKGGGMDDFNAARVVWEISEELCRKCRSRLGIGQGYICKECGRDFGFEKIISQLPCSSILCPKCSKK